MPAAADAARTNGPQRGPRDAVADAPDEEPRPPGEVHRCEHCGEAERVGETGRELLGKYVTAANALSVTPLLQAADIDPTARPEHLTVPQFAALARALRSQIEAR